MVERQLGLEWLWGVIRNRVELERGHKNQNEELNLHCVRFGGWGRWTSFKQEEISSWLSWLMCCQWYIHGVHIDGNQFIGGPESTISSLGSYVSIDLANLQWTMAENYFLNALLLFGGDPKFRWWGWASMSIWMFAFFLMWKSIRTDSV